MQGASTQHRKKQKYHRTVKGTVKFSSWGPFHLGANTSAAAAQSSRRDTGNEKKSPVVWTPHLPRQRIAHFITNITNVSEYAVSTYKKIKIKINTFSSSGSFLAIWDSLNYAPAKPDQLGEATVGVGYWKGHSFAIGVTGLAIMYHRPPLLTPDTSRPYYVFTTCS